MRCDSSREPCARRISATCCSSRSESVAYGAPDSSPSRRDRWTWSDVEQLQFMESPSEVGAGTSACRNVPAKVCDERVTAQDPNCFGWITACRVWLDSAACKSHGVPD